jgi:hypothetical protein
LIDWLTGNDAVVKSTYRLAIAVLAVALLWAGLAYDLSKPTDAAGYLRTALQAADSAHDGASTGALIGRQQLHQQVFPAFAVSAYDDAEKALAGAQKKLAGTPPPDDTSAGLRDRVAPLVQAAVHDLGDAATATDDATLRAAVDALEHDAEQLGDLIEQHQ